MPQSHPDALVLSRRVLRILIKLNLVMGVLIFALLIASMVSEGPVMGALGARPTPGGPNLFLGMRLIMIVGIFAIPVVHIVLTGLLAIVETVSLGTPFVIENARRLKTMAWALLVLELMHLGIAAIGVIVSTEAAPLDINRSISLTRWLAVLMLFVLARVFEQGTRMREDLEGTV